MKSSAAALRAVDQHAREASDALAELRFSQQAYVAGGQSVSFWMPKVAATIEAASTAVIAMRDAASSPEARTAGEQAAGAIAEFTEVDRRARDYIRSEQMLMASDVIFTEGGQLAAVAARQVEAARQAEHQWLEAKEATARKQELTILTAGAGITAVATLILGVAGTRRDEDEEPNAAPAPTRAAGLGLTGDEGVVSHAKPTPVTAQPPISAPSRVTAPAHARGTVVLKAAADLSTDFGRVRDSDELNRLLARSADLLDATGLIVWMASPSAAGGESESVLRPVLAHGYAPAMLARMPAMPRSADNAAAAAWRTGTQQIVLSKPGGGPGAIVAPILSADGCVGALSAEIKAGGEGSEAVQAIATMVAAHLASVVSATPFEQEPAAPIAKAAGH